MLRVTAACACIGAATAGPSSLFGSSWDLSALPQLDPDQLNRHLSQFASYKSEDLPPLIYTSGLTASNLDVTIKSNILCSKVPKNTPLQIWPLTNDTTKEFGPLCLVEAFGVVFDKKTGTYHDHRGLEVDIENFGALSGLIYGDFVDSSLQQYGYQLGVNLFGAPFDWRMSDQGHTTKFYPNFKALVERVYAQTGKKPTIIAPSYGPQNVLGFLRTVTQEWKDHYIGWFIANSPVWSGTPIVLAFVLGGVSPLTALTRGLPACYWLMPRPGSLDTEWGEDEVLVRTPNHAYTASDIPVLLKAVGLHDKAAMYEFQLTQSVLADFDFPGVNTYVTYGTDLPTIGSISYSEDFKANKFKLPANASLYNSTEMGDGAVPLRSSKRSFAWVGATGDKQLLHKAFPGQQHANCFPGGSDHCFADVLSLLINGTKPSGAV